MQQRGNEEGGVGTNAVHHEANRLLSALVATLSAALALWALWIAVSWDNLPYVLHEFEALPLWVRVLLAVAFAAAFGTSALEYVGLVVRPTAFVIGDEGIERRSVLWPRRAVWSDFSHFVQHDGEDGEYVNLHFRRAAGGAGKALVMSLAGYPGLNRELVVQDARKRLIARGVSPRWSD